MSHPAPNSNAGDQTQGFVRSSRCCTSEPHSKPLALLIDCMWSAEDVREKGEDPSQEFIVGNAKLEAES